MVQGAPWSRACRTKVGHAIRGGIGTIAETVGETAETIAGTVGDQGETAAKKVASGSKAAVSTVRKNALYTAVGLFVAGLVLGMVVPIRKWLQRKD